MKSFSEYREYLQHQLNHLIINNDQDLLSFTKLLLNYGKVAVKYYPEDIAKLAHKHKIYGLKEYEILDHFKSVQFKDNQVIIKTKNKTYTSPLKSVTSEFLKPNIDVLDIFILISVALDNKQQALFQIMNRS